MKEIIKNKNSMAFEDIFQNPAFAHVHEALKRVQNKPASQLIPKKHALALTLIVEQKVMKLHNENPNMSLKKVVTTVFEPLTDDIPAPLLMQLTQTIIDRWAKLSQPVLQEPQPVLQDNAVAMAA